MRRQSRSATFASVEIPVSALYGSDLAKDYLPSLHLVADAELEKMGAAGASELERREALRRQHVKAGRVRYVYKTNGYGDNEIWIVSGKPKGQERGKEGRLLGHSVSGPREGVSLALMSLEGQDDGAVIYVDADGYSSVEPVVDLRPSECEALKSNGKHDWFYVPTGDDVCRSCGLVS